MAHHRAEDDLDITKEELKNIKEALKEKEFRNLLGNYFEEVSDPKNKALFQKELTELERERGVDIVFINPEAGYVIKSSIDGKQKTFINICSNENVGRPSSSITSKDGSPGLNWSIPYLQGHPRDDLDNKNQRCSVYDVVFHPDTLYLANKNVRIKNLVEDIALSAVEDSFNVKLDRKNLAFPKLRYKGAKVATVIRKRREDYINKNDEKDDLPLNMRYPYPPPPAENFPKVTTPRGNYDNEDSLYTTPRYVLKHRRDIDMQEFTNAADAKFHSVIPTNLIVEIDLPLVRSAMDVNLEVVDKSLSLISENPAKYKLSLSLPYSVNDEKGGAKFDKIKKKLIVNLPVKRSKIQHSDFVREDSGIESDANQNNCSSSEEDVRKNVELLHVNDTANEIYEEKSVDANVLARTSEEVKKHFLKSDFHYSFPNSSVSVEKNLVTLRVVVKNIDPQSIGHQFVCESTGVHIKFSTLGAGFYPNHYAVCMRIPGIILDTSTLSIDVWDNSLIAALKFNIGVDGQITSYFIGTFLDSMEEKKIVSTYEINNSAARENVRENVTESIELGNENYCEAGDDSDLITNENLQSRISEISAVGKRSILKGSRSLSESHTDDYNTWSSLDSESHDDLVASKKTVRFSDVVSKKIFRANSSILGQKKKNEKKSRNRKKAAYERMLSAGSEESCEEYDSVSELSDVSSDDSSNGSTGSANTLVPSSKRHRRRGAKNQRKAAATAKHNHLSE